jgi:RND family efflux transporter MFP subunit
MKKIYIPFLLVVGISLSGCGEAVDTSTNNKDKVLTVQVKEVSNAGQATFLTASGKIASANSANLSTRMMGFVTKIHVKVGDKVTKGQLLLSVNNTDLSAQNAQASAGITEATAAFVNAEKDYHRFQNLFADTSASQKELDDMKARYEMAKARLEASKQVKNQVASQYAYTAIRAPFNGVITNKFIDEGAMASPGSPLLAIETPGIFEVSAMVPESEISQITSGTKVTVLVSAINASLKGEVTEVSASARNTGGQYLVKVVLDKTEAPVLSGMFASVQFPVEQKSTSTHVLIPKAAIVERGQLSGVYTVSESNTALLRWLRLGRTFGDQVEVLSGLSQEELYIVSAEGKLYNGVKITIQ